MVKATKIWGDINTVHRVKRQRLQRHGRKNSIVLKVLDPIFDADSRRSWRSLLRWKDQLMPLSLTASEKTTEAITVDAKEDKKQIICAFKNCD